jgi:hypothetical protein
MEAHVGAESFVRKPLAYPPAYLGFGVSLNAKSELSRAAISEHKAMRFISVRIERKTVRIRQS